MKAIVAVDNNWGIGKDNDLLISLPEDMKFFRETTMNKIVIMGRKTLESFPNQKPLPNRINIVISRQKDLKLDGVMVCNSIQESINYIKENLGEEKLEDTFFIGGESIYKQCLEYCDTLYITKIKKDFEADRYFPNIEKTEEWEMVYSEKNISKKDNIEFEFTTYKKN